MRAPIRFLFFVALSVLVSMDPPSAQAPSPDQMTQGAAVFQKVCSSCHGAGGTGGRAASLVDNRRLRALSPAEIENIIRNGMPNGMPPFGSMPEADLQAVTAFVRSFNASAFDVQPAGDVAAGGMFFSGKGQCATCHIARGRGAAGGPDLSNIGRQMTVPELTRALLEPDATIAAGLCDRSSPTEGRPHAARFRPQRRQSRAAAADNRRPPRGGRQGHCRHHARNWIGDAAAESDTG